MQNIQLRRHLFLTGAKQVGKSTIIQKILTAGNFTYTGYHTRPLFLNGERRGILLHCFPEMPPMENDCLISARIAMKRSIPLPEVFEANGVTMLERSMAQPADLILMDELGKHEKDAPNFCRKILEVLDQDRPVLGVLQDCSSPLTEAIRLREDVTVITVTEENRDSLADWLVAAYPASLHHLD